MLTKQQVCRLPLLQRWLHTAVIRTGLIDKYTASNERRRDSSSAEHTKRPRKPAHIEFALKAMRVPYVPVFIEIKKISERKDVAIKIRQAFNHIGVQHYEYSYDVLPGNQHVRVIYTPSPLGDDVKKGSRTGHN